MAGEITVPEIARQLDAEGVRRIAVVSEDPKKYPSDARFPPGVSFHHRDELDRVQRELREFPGVSALVYDQTCAAEARRLRKRGSYPGPDRRVVINELVCEGCGDCGVQSNCISIEPVESELGPQAPDQPVVVQQGLLLPQGLLPELRHAARRQAQADRSHARAPAAPTRCSPRCRPRSRRMLPSR